MKYNINVIVSKRANNSNTYTNEYNVYNKIWGETADSRWMLMSINVSVNTEDTEYRMKIKCIMMSKAVMYINTIDNRERTSWFYLKISEKKTENKHRHESFKYHRIQLDVWIYTDISGVYTDQILLNWFL